MIKNGTKCWFWDDNYDDAFLGNYDISKSKPGTEKRHFMELQIREGFKNASEAIAVIFNGDSSLPDTMAGDVAYSHGGNGEYTRLYFPAEHSFHTVLNESISPFEAKG